MKRFTQSVAFALVCAAPVAANPYCDALQQTENLPKKFAKKGPFHVDAETGWIVAQDQMTSNFTVTEETRSLWAEITSEFAKRGVKLSALIAPPRPLFAPNASANFGYDPVQAQLDFSAHIASLNDAGIVAPDLSQLAKKPTAEGFYFKRDTHWSQTGALVSAAHLAETLQGRPVAEIIEPIRFEDTYAEKGSLSMVVKETCGQRPSAETVPAPTYSVSGNASALLGTSNKETVALVGTSFSDRYQKDAYQVADALAYALDMDVENFSVTGGGLVGAMEAFITSGALDSKRYKTVVWETPYTTPLTDLNGLRQILGALQNHGQKQDIYSGDLTAEWTTIKHSFSTADHQVLALQIPGFTTGKLDVEFRGADGQKARVKLVKSDRVAANDRSDVWAVSLSALPLSDVKRVKIKASEPVRNASAHLTN